TCRSGRPILSRHTRITLRTCRSSRTYVTLRSFIALRTSRSKSSKARYDYSASQECDITGTGMVRNINCDLITIIQIKDPSRMELGNSTQHCNGSLALCLVDDDTIM